MTKTIKTLALFVLAFTTGCDQDQNAPVNDATYRQFNVMEFECDPERPMELPEGASIVSVVETDGEWTGHSEVQVRGDGVYSPYCSALVRIMFVY